MTGSRKVAQKVAQRRGEIYAAATDLFAAQGYRAASMRELATRLGLSKATLYHYVKSKEELLTLLYTEEIAQNTAQMRLIMARGLPAQQTLREVLVMRVEHTARRQGIMRVFYEEELELPPALSGPMQAERKRYEDTLLALVEEGLQAGVLHSPVSPRMTVNILLGAVNWTYRWYKPEGELAPHAFAEGVVDVVLGGILNSDNRSMPTFSDG